MAATGQHYVVYPQQRQTAPGQAAVYPNGMPANQWNVGYVQQQQTRPAVAPPPTQQQPFQQRQQSPAYPQPAYPVGASSGMVKSAPAHNMPPRGYYVMHPAVSPNYPTSSTAAASGRASSAAEAPVYIRPRAVVHPQTQVGTAAGGSYEVLYHRAQVPPSSSAYAPTPPATVQHQHAQQHQQPYASQHQAAYMYYNDGSVAPMIAYGQQAMVQPPAEPRQFTLPIRNGVLLPPFQLEHNREVSKREFDLPQQLYDKLMSSSTMELQLRCFHRDDASHANNWPQQQPSGLVSVAVGVNGIETPVASLHRPLYVKRQCRPGKNALSIAVKQCCCSHFFALQLVERVPVDAVAQNVVNAKNLSLDSARQRVTAVLRQTGARWEDIPLRCPLSRRRISMPARGVNCCHSQCFDLQTFLEYNSERTVMVCPCCGVALPLNDVQVDGFVCSILGLVRKADPLGNAVTAIRLDPAEQMGWRYLGPADMPHASTAAAATRLPPAAGQLPPNAGGMPQLQPQQHKVNAQPAQVPSVSGGTHAGGKRRKSSESDGYSLKRQRSDPPQPLAGAEAILSPYSMPSASSTQWIMSPTGAPQSARPQPQQQPGSAQKMLPQPSPLTPGTPGQAGYNMAPLPSVPSASSSGECPASVAGSAPFTPASVGSTNSTGAANGGAAAPSQQHKQQHNDAAALDRIDQATLDNMLGSYQPSEAVLTDQDLQLYLNDSSTSDGVANCPSTGQEQQQQPQLPGDQPRQEDSFAQPELDWDDLLSMFPV